MIGTLCRPSPLGVRDPDSFQIKIHLVNSQYSIHASSEILSISIHLKLSINNCIPLNLILNMASIVRKVHKKVAH